MATRVRWARDDDVEFIDALGLQTASDTVSAVRKLSTAAARDAYRRLVLFCRDRPGTITFVAEQEGQRVGFLILVTDLPDDVSQIPQAFVAYVAVPAKHRRRGVGRALIQAAIAEGVRRGLPHVSLMVSADNSAAEALYKSEGFAAERILMTRPLEPGSDG
jgi:ribosomal protein S18 acetylase RimI-like enzyme